MGQILKAIKNKFYVPTFKNPTQLTYEFSRIIVSLIFGVAAFAISRFLYFTENPLLGVPYTGGTLSGLAFFALIYYLTPFIIKAIAEGISIVFQSTISETLARVYTSPSTGEKKPPKVYTTKSSPVLLDTSSIIDARICGVVEMGFIDSEIIVPQFVIDELHLISDSRSKIKRDKGRRGLNVLGEIKRIKGKGFKVYPTKKVKDVDGELVALAKKLKARVATVDYNLFKVATIKGIKVLNVNSLANVLKAPVVPGDVITVKLHKAGKENGQAVGYLDDGTMLVVNKASDHIKKTVQVEVTKILQTDAGQMIFCDLVEGSNKS